jgi:acetyltransferase-like isoleucine patch superfamily enzyme
LRLALKRLVQGLSLIGAFPAALLCGFGRITMLWTVFTHICAVLPGVFGNFYRAAFYKLTLDDCAIDVVIAFGTFFSRRQAVVERNVSIGSYCVIGRARIGTRTQISSHVEIPGGRLQHTRDAQGRLSDAEEHGAHQVVIGADCWIGAAAVVLADVGAKSTIGAGSVVTKDIPEGVVAVGVPAKPIKHTGSGADGEMGGNLGGG